MCRGLPRGRLHQRRRPLLGIGAVAASRQAHVLAPRKPAVWPGMSRNGPRGPATSSSTRRRPVLRREAGSCRPSFAVASEHRLAHRAQREARVALAAMQMTFPGLRSASDSPAPARPGAAPTSVPSTAYGSQRQPSRCSGNRTGRPPVKMAAHAPLGRSRMSLAVRGIAMDKLESILAQARDFEARLPDFTEMASRLPDFAEMLARQPDFTQVLSRFSRDMEIFERSIKRARRRRKKLEDTIAKDSHCKQKGCKGTLEIEDKTHRDIVIGSSLVCNKCNYRRFESPEYACCYHADAFLEAAEELKGKPPLPACYKRVPGVRVVS